MRILVLHQNKFERVGYDRAFDHDEHDVVYAGPAEDLDNIPAHVRCGKLELAPDSPVADQLRPWLRERPVDRIFARRELLILPAAVLREEFGIPGMRPAVALQFRDKVVMKEILDRAGIRVPRWYPVTALPERIPWSGKVVVKPRAANASRGVVVCDDYAAARALIAERGGEPVLAEQYEIEEYLDGPVCAIDGFLFRGEPVAVQVARYVGTCLDYEHGKPSGTVQYDAPELAEWACRCVRALGGETLTFHLEAILTADGPVFLEVAARGGGGHLGEMLFRRTGVHLDTVDMATDVRGELATDLIREPTPGTYYGDFLFPGHVYAGAPVSVSVPPEVLADPMLVKYQIHPEGVPTTTAPGYRPEHLAFSGMIAGPDPATLESWLWRTFAAVTVSPGVLR
ncbi:ATP-grasp domain-containing protein [Nocardia tenerifensis]|uniref:ATP-grasp domain-containing protein n=1 Tax=Nocardia tenerifensis TaxID=228006 RepID=A0A318K597_9NOCA|nr:ATP-grasp domain-containing protein [Nocardia tenerifensis]PXX58143.1 ATP-grasp domain-containing protein [Nocardia tenerifensis]